MAGSVIKLNEFSTAVSLNPGSFIVGYETPTLNGEIKFTLDTLVNSLKNSSNWNSTNLPDIDASKITSGVLDVPRIPNLDASKITTGILDIARIPHHTHDASDITGTILIGQIQDLSATYLNRTLTGVQTIAAPLNINGTVNAPSFTSNFTGTTGISLTGAGNAYFRNTIYVGVNPIRFDTTLTRGSTIQTNAEGTRNISGSNPSGGIDGDTWMTV